jgi:hypothetical protein
LDSYALKNSKYACKYALKNPKYALKTSKYAPKNYNMCKKNQKHILNFKKIEYGQLKKCFNFTIILSVLKHSASF